LLKNSHPGVFQPRVLENGFIGPSQNGLFSTIHFGAPSMGRVSSLLKKAFKDFFNSLLKPEEPDFLKSLERTCSGCLSVKAKPDGA